MNLLTVKEVAQRLGVSPQLVYLLAAKKQLPAYRIGASGRGAIRFRVEDVASFLESCRVNPPTSRAPRTNDRTHG